MTRNEKRAKLSRDFWAKNREYVLTCKDGPCMDCGIKYPPYVMHFDHRPDEEKLFGLAKMATRGLDKIKAEIAKCDLVCANCHAERTHRRTVAQVGRAPGS